MQTLLVYLIVAACALYALRGLLRRVRRRRDTACGCGECAPQQQTEYPFAGAGCEGCALKGKNGTAERKAAHPAARTAEKAPGSVSGKHPHTGRKKRSRTGNSGGCGCGCG